METQVRSVIEEVLAADPAMLDDAALHELVVAAQRADAEFAAARARLCSAWDARTIWAQDRSRSGAARLARDARCSPRRAGAELRRARKLRSMPVTRDVFEQGRLSIDAVDLLCAANHHPLEVMFARDEAYLVERAATQHFTDFAREIAHWGNIADDHACEDRAERRHDQRYARTAKTLDDVVDITARLDPIQGEIYCRELDRLERELFDADWAEARMRLGDAATASDLARTADQRRADAMVQMARRSAAMPADAKQGRVLITVLVGYETFKGRVCELADGTVLTPGQVAAALTEADIERIVFESPSRVIDVSERRCFTGALRRAIEVRDRHCTHPGCRVAAEHCHVDHTIEWTDGGETSLDNGRLLCPAHNRQRPGRTTQPAMAP